MSRQLVFPSLPVVWSVKAHHSHSVMQCCWSTSQAAELLTHLVTQLMSTRPRAFTSYCLRHPSAQLLRAGRCICVFEPQADTFRCCVQAELRCDRAREKSRGWAETGWSDLPACSNLSGICVTALRAATERSCLPELYSDYSTAHHCKELEHVCAYAKAL